MTYLKFRVGSRILENLDNVVNEMVPIFLDAQCCVALQHMPLIDTVHQGLSLLPNLPLRNFNICERALKLSSCDIS